MSANNGKARILVVDDEPVNLALVMELLSSEYQVLQGAENGRDGLAQAQAERPDLILTDIAMPDMSGYDLCRTLKADPDTRHIPVIFLSGAVELEEHLAGHDAGGEDFLAKPFKPAELFYKVSNALRTVEERKRMASDVDNAFHTAMTAMSSAAELGVVLGFVRNSFACTNYEELAEAIIAACNEFGLYACVQLRGRSGKVSRNRAGRSTSLESDVLDRLSGFGRIVDFYRRTAINYDGVSLMITDMPIDDAERYGRLRDQLAILAESADARVRALDGEITVHAKHRALRDLVDSTRQVLADIDRRHRDNRSEALMIMHGMLATIEQSFARVDLSDEQENYILGVMRSAVGNVADLFDKGLAIDNHLSLVTERLGQAGEGALAEQVLQGG